MATVTYLKSATNETYSESAFGYISTPRVRESILSTSATLGISAGAIAGAMAEENTAFGFSDEVLDKYAKSGLDPTVAIATLPAAIAGGPVAVAAWLAANATQLATTRTHEQWQAYYSAAIAFKGKPGATDKIMNPALIDAGPGNFKIATAIDMVVNFASKAEYATLGLASYLNNYPKLVEDLMDETGALTAKLYGLYMKEYAEPFFKNNDAYAGQWDSLPQTFRDALLVTYTNIGEAGMTKLLKTPYEPQPALTTGGGMNHLRNAAAIGDALGLAGYGADAIGVDDFAAQAKSGGEAGLAARYALLQLRHVAVEEIDYSAKNTNGELNRYTDGGPLTDQWIKDRSAHLGWLVIANRADTNVLDGSDYGYMDFRNWEFSDRTTDRTITVKGQKLGFESTDPANKVIFGTVSGDTILGGVNDDYLYGMSGNDTLEGKGGADHLEGGLGFDTYKVGDGHDTLLDTNGDGAVYWSGDLLTGGAMVDIGRWVSSDGRYQYDLADNGFDLVVSARSGTGSAIIKDFLSGELGIALGGWSTLPRADTANNRRDNVYGTSQAELILTHDRSDYVIADGGNDEVHAGADDDIVNGGHGDDVLYGDGGNDWLKGDLSPTVPGNDIIMGGAGNDLIDGGAGDDILHGEDSTTPLGETLAGRGDWMNGGAGNDYLFGSRQDDFMAGGAGDDRTFGGGGNDVLLGDAEYRPDYGPLYATLPGNALWVDGVYVYDWVRRGGTFTGSKAQFILAPKSDANNWTVATDAATGALTFTPTLARPVSQFDTNPTIGGNDVLDGGIGNDWIDGQAGDDTLYGNEGNDTLIGGAGADIYRFATHLNQGTDDGHDRILFADGLDWIEWGPGISSAGVTVSDAGADLVLALDEHNSITVQDYLGGHALGGVKFADGTFWNADDIGALLAGGSNAIRGSAGDDALATDGAQTMPFVVRARGTVADGVAPIMEVRLDGELLGSVQVSSASYADYAFVGSLMPSQIARLDVVFRNDAVIGGEDRNLYVDSISFGNRTFRPGDSGVTYDRGGGALAFDGNNVIAGQTGMYWNGALRIDLPADLAGTVADDTLLGLGGDDSLSGGGGDDRLNGGAGNDLLVGADGADSLLGESGNDVLHGGADADTLRGGGGDDVLYADSVFPERIVVRARGSTAAGEGPGMTVRVDGVVVGSVAITDTNYADYEFTGDFRLGAASMLDIVFSNDAVIAGEDRNLFVEAVRIGGTTLTPVSAASYDRGMGAAAFDGENLIAGQTGMYWNGALRFQLASDFFGAAGDDVLEGGAGSDMLEGGAGNDTYLFDRDGGADRIVDTDSTTGNADVLAFGNDIAVDQIWLRRTGNDLELSLIGTDDRITVGNWYGGDAHHVEQFRAATGETLLDSQVDALVSAMAVFAPPASGQTTLPPDYQAALAPVIAANWR